MNKKIVGIVAALIIIVGIAVTTICGVSSGLIYREHKELDINIGKEFENNEIKELVKEVVEGKEVIISKVELYKDMVNIKIEEISEEQIEQINSKINEKYSIDNKVEDIVITEVPKVNEFDLIKPYIIPTAISLILTVIFLIIYLIVYKKTSKEEVEVNIPKKILELVLSTIVVELVFALFFVITRFPINGFVIPVAILLFIITAGAQFIKK